MKQELKVKAVMQGITFTNTLYQFVKAKNKIGYFWRDLAYAGSLTKLEGLAVAQSFIFPTTITIKL